jgi:hypothetical protein
LVFENPSKAFVSPSAMWLNLASLERSDSGQQQEWLFWHET